MEFYYMTPNISNPMSLFSNKHSLDNDERTSPVNFFFPNFDKFPLFKYANTLHKLLNEGDCIFIPAYYFSQMNASKFEKNSPK